ncbi:MAG: hypothetical protein LBE74_00095 [Treponema sp.]|nr:hypothetical protein [Treponema sp.]
MKNVTFILAAVYSAAVLFFFMRHHRGALYIYRLGSFIGRLRSRGVGRRRRKE